MSIAYRGYTVKIHKRIMDWSALAYIPRSGKKSVRVTAPTRVEVENKVKAGIDKALAEEEKNE